MNKNYLEMEIDGIDVVIFAVHFQDDMENAELVWNYKNDTRPANEEAFANIVSEAINTLVREIDNGKNNFQQSST